jgi:Double-GTPase 2
LNILGDPDAGKTGALVSLFLLISRAKLQGYSFADSRTLSAFNEISQGALDWDENNPPMQFTHHTEMADPRTPGFLHLRLRRGENEKVDFLLPDLPGEWSQSFIDEDNNDRLQFLKRADVIWLMMDGSQLREPSTRHYVIHRTQLLVGRLQALIDDLPPLVLVLSRRDGGEVPTSVLAPVIDEATNEGLRVSVVQIASFGDQNADVKPGFGIDALMQTCRRDMPEISPTWSDPQRQFDEVRAILRYRHPERR